MKTILATITFTTAAFVAFAQPPAKSDIQNDTTMGSRTTRIDSTGSYQATSVPSDSSNYKQNSTSSSKYNASSKVSAAGVDTDSTDYKQQNKASTGYKKHKQVTTTSTKKTTKHSSASTKSKK